MKFILAKKLNMTQVFREDGEVIPVTAVLAMPNIVTQIKTNDKEKYNAVQVGFGTQKKIKKSQAGHLKGLEPVKTMKEFRVQMDDTSALKRGDKITVEAFQPGDKVKVAGISKGKGFQGVVKRHGFHGSPKTHGHKDQERMPGSIGAGGVQRVFKGMRMAGRMGGEHVTVSGLQIVEVNPQENILYIKGAVPGSKNSLLLISGAGKMELQQEKIQPEEAKVEAPASEAVVEQQPAEAAAGTNETEAKTE